MRRNVCFVISAFSLMMSGSVWGQQTIPFRVQLPWYPNIEYVSFYYGHVAGYFADEGIRLDLPQWKLGINAVDEVAQRRADIGVDDGVNFLMAVDRGEELVAICAFMQETPQCLVSLRHKLDSINDLAGKKVATVKGCEYLVDYFRLKFPQLKDTVRVQLLDDNVAALQNGDIDVSFFFETAQVPLLRLRGYRPNVLRYRDIGYDVYSHVIFVRKDFYRKNQLALQKFLKALHLSIGKTFENPKRTVDFFAETIKYTEFVQGPFKNNEEYKLYQEACFKLLHYYMTKGVGENYGLMNRHRWRSMIKTLRGLNLLKNEIKEDDVFMTELLNGLYETRRK